MADRAIKLLVIGESGVGKSRCSPKSMEQFHCVYYQKLASLINFHYHFIIV